MQIAATVDLDGQYRALREAAGLVDRSERGKLIVRGAEALDYLDGQLTNDVEPLEPGEGCYAALLDRKGHMQADLRLLRLGSDELWLDTEAIASERLRRQLDLYKVGRQVEIEDVTADHAMLSVVGPAALEVSGAGASAPEYSHREMSLDGVACRVVFTDLGLDLICAAADADAARDALVRSGGVAVSEDAAEIVRVESGRPRFGAEMSEETIPAEAGINERAVSFTKGCYIGQETVARLHYKGKPNRHLRGLRLEAPAERGEPIRNAERDLGAIGTACLSPARGPIALAVVRREAAPGDRVAVGEDGNGAEIVELPF
jgi:tRNA-modifying protein YgfZ